MSEVPYPTNIVRRYLRESAARRPLNGKHGCARILPVFDRPSRPSCRARLDASQSPDFVKIS